MAIRDWNLIRRRRKLIDRKQQLRFAVEITLYAFLFPMIVVILAMGERLSIWLIRWERTHAPSLPIAFLNFCLTYWAETLLALVLVGCISIWFSHKIFGPVYRFQDALQRKRKTPSDRVSCRLRRKDYLHAFSRDLEDFLNQEDDQRSSAEGDPSA